MLDATALWLLIAAVWGFGGVARHLPPFGQQAAVIQLHAIGFGIWTVLVPLQLRLMGSTRRSIHIAVGSVAVASCIMGVVTGLMTIARAVALDRRTLDEGLLLLLPIVIGAVLVGQGVALRRHSPAAHGQSMLLATALFTTLAVDRIGFLTGLHAWPWAVTLVRLAPVVAIGSLELRQRKRFSWRTMLAGAALLAVDAPSLLSAA